MEDRIEEINILLNFGVPIALLVIAYLVGTYLEKRHLKSIKEREEALHGFPIVTFETMPADWTPGSSGLVSGSVVISLDYFKRVIAGLRALVGGRVKTYEPLLERARREALLRMAESAESQGYDAILNVRLETSRLANSARNGQGIAGIEMLAFGTALNLQNKAG